MRVWGRLQKWVEEESQSARIYRRLAETESQGLVAEVLFPNTIPPFFAQGNLTALEPNAADYERRWAGLQAHNRWLADFCAKAPGRRAGIAQIMLHDIPAAVAEVRWAKENGLTGGGMVMVLMMGVAYLRVRLKRVAG